MFSSSLRRNCWWFFVVLCVLSALTAIVHWWPILSMELHGALDGDAHLYFTLGRGMLNDLHLWSDLFESKPPGMFQLAALSLLVTGNELFAIAMQMLVYAAIPALLGIFGWTETRRNGQPIAVCAAVTSLGILLGLLLDFYLEERAGGFQTESFGSAFASFYFLLVALGGDRPSHWRSLGLGALIFVTLWMKEPFILPLLAGSLLLTRNLQHWLRTFLFPCIIAGVMLLVALIVLGSLGDYMRLYLPAMIQTRVATDRFDPIYLRGFTAGRLYGNVTLYYTAPILGYLLAMLWMTFPFLRRRTVGPWWELPLIVITSFVVYYCMWYGFFPLARFNAWLLYDAQLDESTFPTGLATLQWLLPALAVLWFLCWKRGYAHSILIGAVVLHLSATVVGISVYAYNHFAFAFPVFVALGFVFLRYAASFPVSIPTAVIAAMMLFAGFTYRPGTRQMELLRDRIQHTSAAHTGITAKVDGLLDACDIDRYGALTTYDRLSFARHSPIGPMIVMSFFQYLGWDHPLILETQRRIREEAQIVITVGSGADHDLVIPQIATSFTEAAPDCAKPFLPIEGLKVFFRAQGA